MDDSLRRFLEMIASDEGIRPTDRKQANPYISARIWKEAKRLYPDEISDKIEVMLARLILHYGDPKPRPKD